MELFVCSVASELPSAVFLLEHLGHFFGGFLAASRQPEPDDGVEPVAEELDMVFDIGVYLFFLRAGLIIRADEVALVVAQLEIGGVKKLIFFVNRSVPIWSLTISLRKVMSSDWAFLQGKYFLLLLLLNRENQHGDKILPKHFIE